MALVTSGLTVATVVGVPFGNWIGSLFGWRATFAMVALLGAIALAGLLLGCPEACPKAQPRSPNGSPWRVTAAS